MTIDEAIQRAKDKAEHYYSMIDVYHTDEGIYLEEETRSRIYAEEQEQLAEWLEELKAWRSGERVRTANKNTETLIFDIGE